MDLWIYSVAFAVIGIPIALIPYYYFTTRWKKETDPYRKLVFGLKGTCWGLGIASLFSWFTLQELLSTLEMLRSLGYPLDINPLPPEQAIQITNLVVGNVISLFTFCFWGISFYIVKFLETQRGGTRTEGETVPI